MTLRPPGTVILLTIITFGIYGLVWMVKAKGEMVALGADIPTSWLLIVPFANFLYMWKWAEGAEKVTNGKASTAVTFLLMLVLFPAAQFVAQTAFNEVATPAVPSA